MPTLAPFLIFSLFCAFIVVLLLVLFKIGAYFGKSDADEFRAVRCPQCQTRRKPEKTGAVRNLVELEMRCPRCGHISWDMPPRAFIVVLLLVLFKIGAYFGKSDADEFRAVRCPQCQTRRKPEKTGAVRNLVELEMRCPRCGHISWDMPPKTNLSTRPSDRDDTL